MNHKKIEVTDHIHNGPMVSWLINHRCNFQCDYCFFTNEFRAVESKESGIYTVDHITKSFDDTEKSWWIYITGGEPFLYPSFIELCMNLTRKHFLTINTNLSTNNTKEFAEKIDSKRVYSINAALHIIEREKRGGLDKFIDAVKYFQDKGFEIRVEYVLHPSLIDRVEGDMEKLTSNGINIFNLKTYRGRYNKKEYPISYTKKERSFISEHALDKTEVELIDKSVSFFGKKCSAGIDFFSMDPGGNMRRCSTSSKSYGNIFKDTFKFDTSSKPCPFPKCGCPYEGILRTEDNYTNISKTAIEIGKELPSFIHNKITTEKIKNYIQRKLS